MADQPPWPVVGECFAGSNPAHRCPQCDGSHAHRWVTWHDAPEVSAGTSVTGGQSGPGKPTRCAICGGRKCDQRSCILRRHHREGHEEY